MAVLSKSEERMLRTLDQCCYEDSENGGDGWATLDDLAAAYGVQIPWVSLLLTTLRHRGYVERRGSAENHRSKLYAPTEAGAALLTAKQDTPPYQGVAE